MQMKLPSLLKSTHPIKRKHYVQKIAYLDECHDFKITIETDIYLKFEIRRTILITKTK